MSESLSILSRCLDLNFMSLFREIIVFFFYRNIGFSSYFLPVFEMSLIFKFCKFSYSAFLDFSQFFNFSEVDIKKHKTSSEYENDM